MHLPISAALAVAGTSPHTFSGQSTPTTAFALQENNVAASQPGLSPDWAVGVGGQPDMQKRGKHILTSDHPEVSEVSRDVLEPTGTTLTTITVPTITSMGPTPTNVLPPVASDIEELYLSHLPALDSEDKPVGGFETANLNRKGAFGEDEAPIACSSAELLKDKLNFVLCGLKGGTDCKSVCGDWLD